MSESHCFIAVDLGGTNFKAGLFDAGDHKLHELSEPAEKEDPGRLIEQFVRAISELGRGAGAVAAVGICVPGNVDSRTHEVVASPNYPLLTRMNIFGAVAERTGLRVVADNDANAAALGEAQFGVGKGKLRGRTLVYVTLGTGVGGGVVVDGKLLRGKSGFAGELGHVVVDPDGDPCGCGSWGCVEQFASAPAIVRLARRAVRRHPGSRVVKPVHPDLDARIVADGARDGDPLCVEVMAEVGRALGLAVAGWVNVFNPDWLVIGGGVSKAGDTLLGPIVAEARRRAFRRPFEDCLFSISPLVAEVGLYGAYALARSASGGSEERT